MVFNTVVGGIVGGFVVDVADVIILSGSDKGPTPSTNVIIGGDIVTGGMVSNTIGGGGGRQHVVDVDVNVVKLGFLVVPVVVDDVVNVVEVNVVDVFVVEVFVVDVNVVNDVTAIIRIC